MARRTSTLLILLVLAWVSVVSQQAGLAQQPVESHVVPLKKFSAEHRFETVEAGRSVWVR